MSENFTAGDFLVFQVESGFGLLRILAIDDTAADPTWHLAAYSEFFPDVESIDKALDDNSFLEIGYPHLAVTNRSFECTQAARLRNLPLVPADTDAFEKWKHDENHEVSDWPVRLLLGLR